MGRETRISADRQLKLNHLRSTLTWYNRRLDRVEEDIMRKMRSTDPGDSDSSNIGISISERQCIVDNCKELHRKVYGG